VAAEAQEEEAVMDAGGKAKVGRRDFLRALGAGAGVAVATAGVATGAQADSETNDEKRRARYKESEHVKTFYRVNRYPNKG
jgi:hypothetical protein